MQGRGYPPTPLYHGGRTEMERYYTPLSIYPHPHFRKPGTQEINSISMDEEKALRQLWAGIASLATLALLGVALVILL